jgi:menaquinone-9 beta-reductase
MNSENFDVIIVGAGPAGCACALTLAGSGLKIAVLDKSKVPSDKICGDALGSDVIKQLEKLPPVIKESFERITGRISSHGVRFYSPANECMEVSFHQAGKKSISGFVCQRKKFDEVLVSGIRSFSEITLIENCTIRDIQRGNDEVSVFTDTKKYSSKIIVGADGHNSFTAKNLAAIEKDRNSLCLGLRGYFENVKGFHPDHFIELHFTNEVIPGYIWIFPMADNTANVGIGIPSRDISEKKINLKSLLEKYIHEHPDISPRFKDASMIGKFEAWGIPTGTKKRKISGERFLLAGDAASLVDPFTGEGVGNAIRSGRIAAEHILRCFRNSDFSERFNKEYDNEIYRRMWNELKLSHSMQKLFRRRRLVNYAIRKANRNEQFKELITDVMMNIDVKKRFLRPYFLFKIFFR